MGTGQLANGLRKNLIFLLRNLIKDHIEVQDHRIVRQREDAHHTLSPAADHSQRRGAEQVVGRHFAANKDGEGSG